MIKFTSFLSPNADSVCRTIVDYVANQLDIPARFVDDIPYAERWQQFYTGEIEGAWICGLPYVKRIDRQQVDLELLAAPVMQKSRYKNQPIYFSDIVVHRESNFNTFADLKGVSWAYNEPGSQSGYNVTRYHLAQLGYTSGYFGNIVQSGGHLTSLKMVLDRQVDASAIDSIVLETELLLRPKINREIRIIEQLGPSTSPPWVINKIISDKTRAAIKKTMLDMHLTPTGYSILTSGQIKRLARVNDEDYDLTRRMAEVAETVSLQ